ncbi:MAG: VWA domain-containing protein [Dehalococcoidia bacterium]
MSFGAPGYLWFLLLVPLTVVVLFAWLAWRSHAQRSFGVLSAALVLTIVAPALMIAAIAIATLAAARPQIGEKGVLTEDRGIDLVIVLDVSQSMYATDAEPSRIGRAQAEIIALLDRMQGDRVGLVLFAGRPFVRSPLTSDLISLSRLVEGVHEERALVPAGSDLGTAIRRGREVVERGDAETKALLVISDGEDHGSSISGAVNEARDAGVRLYSAGVGTEAGAAVLDTDPATGAATPRIDREGVPVITRLDPLSLRLMAESGGGEYIELAGAGLPLTGLASELAALDATTFASEVRPERIDRFVVFAWAALAVALAATVVPAIATWRRGATGATPWRRLWPLAGAGMLIGAVCASDVVELNRRGNERYADADYAGAIDVYRTAEALDPEQRELFHNASNALHQAERINEAIDEAKRGLPADDDALAAKIEYALGNHYVAAERLQEALEAYKRSLLADPDDDDAKHNLEVIARQLAETPSPTPTPEAPQIEVTPTPGAGDEDPSGSGDGGAGTPQAGDPGDDNATPDANASPQPSGDSQLTPEQLQQALDEALRGIDEDFTVEEALRALDLLEQQNRRQLEARQESAGGAPDY